MEKLLQLLPARGQPVLLKYSASAIIILVCCATQLGLRHYSGFTGYFVLLAGIFLCGMLFDRGSAFFATAAGLALSVWLLLPDSGFSQSRVWLPLSLFAATSIAAAFLSEGMRKTMERMVDAEKNSRLLLEELRHRSKNDLLSVRSLLHFQSKRSSNPEVAEALEAAAGRVSVLADVGNFMLASPGMVDIKPYLEAICLRLGDMLRGVRAVAVRLDCEDMCLTSSQANSIGMLTNELVTNCLKHAFPGDRAGTINVKLVTDGEILLSVTDDGIGCGEKAGSGVGSTLTQMIARQMGGMIERGDLTPGCRVDVRFPKT